MNDAPGRLADVLEAAFEIGLVVVFGSTAAGRACGRSDVDVAVRCT